MCVTIRGVETILKGSVFLVLADTLAAHSIGGFKAGVGFSLRKCRQCMATYDTMSVQVLSAIIIPCKTASVVVLYRVPSASVV